MDTWRAVRRQAGGTCVTRLDTHARATAETDTDTDECVRSLALLHGCMADARFFERPTQAHLGAETRRRPSPPSTSMLQEQVEQVERQESAHLLTGPGRVSEDPCSWQRTTRMPLRRPGANKVGSGSPQSPVGAPCRRHALLAGGVHACSYQAHHFHFVMHVQHLVLCVQLLPSRADRCAGTQYQRVALEHLAPVGLLRVLPGHLVPRQLRVQKVELRVRQVQRGFRTHAGNKEAGSATSGHKTQRVATRRHAQPGHGSLHAPWGVCTCRSAPSGTPEPRASACPSASQSRSPPPDPASAPLSGAGR